SVGSVATLSRGISLRVGKSVVGRPTGPPPQMETITSEQPTVPANSQADEAAQEPVVPRRSPLRAAIKTGRPKEWIKNVFVFAGLLFSGKFNQPHDVLMAFVT